MYKIKLTMGKYRASSLGIILCVTVVLFSVLSQYFLTIYNITQILHFTSVLLLLSIGQNLIILAGGMEIDLSVGSVVSLSGMVMGLLYQSGVPIIIAIFLTILLGCILGSFNAFCVLKLRIPALIATLATLYMYGGLSLVITNSGTISGFPDEFSWVGQHVSLGIPDKMILIVFPIYFTVLFILKNTEFGRNIYLIGKNEVAAKFAGIQVNKIRFILYLFSGFLASVAGVIMASYLMVAKADIGRDLELQTIVVVMLAGTSIKGGTGTYSNVLSATLIVIIISTGLQLAQINTIWQMGVLGVILLFAVWINSLSDTSH